MIKQWDLKQTNLKRLEENRPEVAVLPVGSVEPHNRHLPEGQDLLHTTYVAEKACEAAYEQNDKVICLPVIPYGVDCNLMDFPLAIHISQQTLDAVVRDVITSLRHYGIRKVLIVNGHGGNDFTPLIRQIQCDLDVHVFQADWWKVGMDQYDSIFDKPDDHAGQFETSIALALFPDWVELENAGNGKVRPFRFEALQKGWVKTSRRFMRLNDQCAAGDPAGASAEKGNKYLAIVIERLSRFLVELAKSKIDDAFPQQPFTE